MSNLGVGGSSGPVLSLVETQQTTVLAGNFDIIVTANGGILPLDDDGIRVATATGPVFQGAGAGQYTIDRVSTPNEINLVTAPLANLDFLCQFIYTA